MVNEFCGFKHGVIGTDKMPADATLNNMKKADLIKLLHTAQHNYESLMWFYTNAVKANMSQLHSNGWIPCSEKLPEEPSIELDDENDIRAAILHNKVTEYIVTIHAASKSTAAYYIGDGFWYDESTKDICPVDAWREFPEGYQKTD